MRLTILGVLIVAACGSGTEEGAVLVIRAPTGPALADRIEIILGSADASTIVDLDDQRANPGDLTEQAARYYRQRSTAGTVTNVTLDGFVIRIESNPAASPDDEFIPFVLTHVRDDDGALRLTGIGTVQDAGGTPASIRIEAGRTERYFVDVVELAPANPDDGLATGTHRIVDCQRDGGFRSGVAWQPANGSQLRLLLPDLGLDLNATDASTRPLDLDCDGHEAITDDCDDLRREFNPDVAEACDGRDADCDGRRLEVVTCALEQACGTELTGVEICLDRGAGLHGQCQGTPQCQCIPGNPGVCNKCILEFTKIDSTNQAPCAPAVDKLKFLGCSPNTPCTVEVAAQPADSAWEATVSLVLDGGGFSSKVTTTNGDVFLKLKLLAPDVPGSAASSVGTVFLLVDDGTTTRHVGYDLQLSGVGPAVACPATPVVAMACS